MVNEGLADLPALSELPSRVKGRRASMVSLTGSAAEGRPVPRISREVPSADFPPLPTISLNAFLPCTADPVPSVLDAGKAVHVTAGRFAIALALKAMGIGKGEKVLVPGFHCTTMVEPVLNSGALPTFYRLTDDLSPDFEDVAAKIEPGTRALMVTHYFGFPQAMEGVRAFCDAHGLLLLEDCAHAYFGAVAGRPVGEFGDFAIASPTKFFPLKDGGCLIFKDRENDPGQLRRQGVAASVVAAMSEVQRAEYYGNLPAMTPVLALARYLRRALRGSSGREPMNTGPGEDAGRDVEVGSDFDPGRIDVAMSGYSSLIYRNVARSRIIAKRRENYRLMVRELEGVAGCRAFMPHLPDQVVPYEVPFWIDDLKRHFPRLEDLAVPMHRFGQFLHPVMQEGTCPRSETLSHHLVQFPCHQDLSPADIRGIAERIRLVLRS